MRKTLLLLITYYALAIALMSCSIEETCGEVTGWSSSFDTYYLYLDDVSVRVNFNTWLKADIGDYICIN